MMAYGECMDKLKEYVDALEKELRKIEVFHRELPLAVRLVRHAIEACKLQMAADKPSTKDGRNLFSGPSDGEVTSKEGPVLEEFIPLKRSEEGRTGRCDGDDHDRPATKKPDWLKSVQLWTQNPNPPANQERRSLIEPKKSNGAFQPFCKEDRLVKAAVSVTMAANSTADNEERVAKEGQGGQRKSRRCWSAELHKRFIHALDQLGGSHAATPKQIRELMKVDGLTNDEVKSHLQKYRLHNRRPSCSAAQSNTSNPQAPQFVVVYAAAAVPTTAANHLPEAADGQAKEIYTPKATLPSSGRQHQEKMLQLSSFGPMHSGGRSCSGVANSNSPASSTTSHVTATSPFA